MGLTVFFAGYSKTVNSTAHPSTSEPSAWSECFGPDFGVARDIVFLKGPSTVVNPVIIWNHGNASPTGWNYCWIRDFNRFYFIKDWKFISNGNWEMSLEVDVMATYRNAIGASSQYVSRSSVRVNSNVVDDLIQTTANITISSNNVQPNPFIGWKQNGLYVVKTFFPLSQATDAGASPYPIYIMNHGQFCTFVEEIINGRINIYGSSTTMDSFDNVLKSWSTNPLDFIISCRFIPFGTVGGNIVDRVSFGNFYVNVGAKLVLLGPLNYTWSVTIPKHPQLNSLGKFTLISASKYELYLPCFGKVEIPQSFLVDESFLTINMILSLYNCEGVVQLSAGGKTLDILKANVSVEIPLQSVYITPSSYVSAGVSAVGAIAGAVTGNPVVSALGAVSAINSIKPVTERIGAGSGDYSEYEREMKLVGSFFQLPARDNYIVGAPCCAVFRLASELSETVQSIFYQCSKVKIRLPASSYEIERVKSIMEEGFYFE